MQRFGYAFPANEQQHWEKPVLSANVVVKTFNVAKNEVVPLPVMHGNYEILGYRIGNMAYLTDVSDIPDATLDKLHGLDVLLLDCLRYRHHPTHFNLEQAIEWATRIAARDTWLIHMTHEMDYDELSARLPKAMHVAYDGLRIRI